MDAWKEFGAALLALRNRMIGSLLSCLTGLDIPVPDPRMQVTEWDVPEWSVSYFPGTMKREEGHLIYYVSIRLGKREYRIWPDRKNDKSVNIF